MTKKHYEAIAETIREYAENDYRYDIENFYSLLVALCDYFESDNRMFDRKKFLAACGLKDIN